MQYILLLHLHSVTPPENDNRNCSSALYVYYEAGTKKSLKPSPGSN